MHSVLERIRRSPLLVRVAPFGIFLLLTWAQGACGEAGRYWIYLAKTGVGAWLIWFIWPAVAEMRWKFSLAGLGAGVAVFVMWVGLDGWLAWMGFPQSYPKFGAGGTPWNPHAQFGEGTWLAWFFVLVRLLGSALVVSALEEVFFRSWLYRYLANPNFETVPLGRFLWLPFLLSSAIFGLEHREWLAGILCGFAYQGLVCWKQRLGDAMTAHAVTNFLLGLWVVWKGAWNFW